MHATDQVKLASLLSQKPGLKDYARITGRTALEGTAGGYGAGALTAMLIGLLTRKFPSSLSGGMARGLVSGATGAGATAGALHGYQAATDNARDRLGPMGTLKRLLTGS